jgi:hypothetical protein
LVFVINIQTKALSAIVWLELSDIFVDRERLNELYKKLYTKKLKSFLTLLLENSQITSTRKQVVYTLTFFKLELNPDACPALTQICNNNRPEHCLSGELFLKDLPCIAEVKVSDTWEK